MKAYTGFAGLLLLAASVSTSTMAADMEVPERPIAFGCQNIPPFCPQFAVLDGMTCFARHKEEAQDSYRAHSPKNACRAEHAIVHQICQERLNPLDFLIRCHQGQME